MSQVTSTKPTITLKNSVSSNQIPQQGLVTAAYGQSYLVELCDGTIIRCVTRGKKNDLACGDHVTIHLTSKDEGVVESISERNTLLFRSNAFKTKMIAANVTQVVFVLASQPSFYEALLNRCLIASEAAGIETLIVLNKSDLEDSDKVLGQLKLYQDLGYPVLSLSAKQDVSPLQIYLKGKTSILVGQSGMGKSTIVNALLPEISVKTREISDVLDSGKHTTTATHLYHINTDTALIDSPGLQEFGLYHLSQENLELAFREFRPFLGHCRFNNCRHLQEPDCAIQNAFLDGHISEERLSVYKQLSKELVTNF
jgi:ribosome biogenesis GTPase / thiamine phosphate phosphatase